MKHKIIATLMVSSGCRIGAISDLKLSNLIYFEKEKLHQILFYMNTREEYFSFCTPECSKYINEYLEYRKRCGGVLTPLSPLIRNDFQQDDLLRIEHPKPVSTYNMKFYLFQVLIKTGLRIPIRHNRRGSKKKMRKEVSANHGYRKFCHTTMTHAKINVEVREMLLGHKIGLSNSYYRPTVEEMLNEYKKCINDLTIDHSHRLQKQVQQLQEQDDYQKYVIDKKMKEKDEEIANMRQAMRTVS